MRDEHHANPQLHHDDRSAVRWPRAGGLELGEGRPGPHRSDRGAHRRSAADPRRCRSPQLRKPVCRTAPAWLPPPVACRCHGDGARRDSSGCRDRAQLRSEQGPIHCTREGGHTRAHAREPRLGRAAERWTDAPHAAKHAGDRRRGKARLGRRAVVHAHWQKRRFVMRASPAMADEIGDAGASSDEVLEQAAQPTLAANPLVGVRGRDILDSARALLDHMMSKPGIAAQQYLSFLGELGRIVTGASELAPDAKDKRFADPAWKESGAYRALAQCYLAWGRSLNRFVEEATMDKRDAERARFIASLFIDAMSPTNSLAGNPAAMKKLIETSGASLVHGLQNFLGNLARNGGLPAQVDARKFAVGKNLATTPGWDLRCTSGRS